MSNLKILFTEGSANLGGQQVRLLREMSWLIRRGYHVVLACPRGSRLAARAGALGLPWEPCEFGLAGAANLFGTARRWEVEIVHTRGSEDTLAALLLGLPVVRSRHLTVPQRVRWQQRWLYRHGASHTVAASEHIKDGLVLRAGLRPEDVTVVGEGVNLAEYHPFIDRSKVRQEWGVRPDEMLFGVISQFRGEKGLRPFVNAAMRVLKTEPRARFVIVGDGQGSYAENLRRKVQKHFSTERPGVFLAGYRHDIPWVTAALDALVVPSIEDAQTMVIPQAFAMRKPVIATRVGGIPEIVTHEETGLLVPPNDEVALAAAMLRFLGDPIDMQRLAGRAYAEARWRLCFDDRMEKLVDVYETVLDRRALAFDFLGEPAGAPRMSGPITTSARG